MKPTPMLDFWQKPAGAGEPVAVIATTFAFDSDFFEKSCLARFLEVSSVDEGSGSVEDIVAAVELHELLRNARVTVLADRSAPVQRTSLNWDLLSCRVQGGLLHAKVAVLIWEKATRVIVGSANLTEAGYRRQIELGLAADLGSNCLLPQHVLAEIADELESYLRLVPGYAAEIAVFARAMSTLELFRQRVARQPAASSTVRVAFAPTNMTRGALDPIGSAWSGAHPLRATHLSPFWDSDDRTALESVRKLLTGRPASNRAQQIGVVLGPRGQTSFSHHLESSVDAVRQLKPFDSETRTLHAKCLLIESDQWVAAMIGSSNHTKAGLGLGSTSRRHREINLWLGAGSQSKEGKALLGLVQLGARVAADAEEVEPTDEDEESLPSLPASFGLCRIRSRSDGGPWELYLGIEKTHDMPEDWCVRLDDGRIVLKRREWDADGQRSIVAVGTDTESLPMFLTVQWEDFEVPWAVVADDPHGLPPGPVLSSLRAQHLLGALAKGQSLSQALRAMLEERGSKSKDPGGSVVVDPLKRLEVRDSLLRKGRALAASLGAMQRRLERQVVTTDSLRARLAGPLGPEFVALKVAQAFEAGQQTRAEAIFTIAEITLSVGRVNWTRVTEHIDRTQGLALVERTLDCLDELRVRVGNEPENLASYASRAIKEARRCVMV